MGETARGLMVSSRPIFVLGAERSGVAALGEMVRRWGAFVAPPDHVGELGDFSRQLLAAAGGAWHPDLASHLAALANEPAWRDRALALVRPQREADRPWVLTLARSSLLVPFWEEVLPNPICLVAVRSPLDCARSFATIRFPEKLASVIQIAAYFGFRWQCIMLLLLGLCERHPAHLLVSYEALFASPAEQVRRIRRFLDRATGVKGSGEEHEERMLSVIDPGLRHHEAEAAFLDLPQVTAIQKDLYLYLERRLAGEALAFDPAQFAIPSYAWEYLRSFEVFFELEKRPPPPAGSGAGYDRQEDAA